MGKRPLRVSNDGSPRKRKRPRLSASSTFPAVLAVLRASHGWGVKAVGAKSLAAGSHLYFTNWGMAKTRRGEPVTVGVDYFESSLDAWEYIQKWGASLACPCGVIRTALTQGAYVYVVGLLQQLLHEQAENERANQPDNRETTGPSTVEATPAGPHGRVGTAVETEPIARPSTKQLPVGALPFLKKLSERIENESGDDEDSDSDDEWLHERGDCDGDPKPDTGSKRAASPAEEYSLHYLMWGTDATDDSEGNSDEDEAETANLDMGNAGEDDSPAANCDDADNNAQADDQACTADRHFDSDGNAEYEPDREPETDEAGNGVDERSSDDNAELELTNGKATQVKTGHVDHTDGIALDPPAKDFDDNETRVNVHNSINDDHLVETVSTQQLGSVEVAVDHSALDLRLREALHEKMELEKKCKELRELLERATMKLEAKRAEILVFKHLIGQRTGPHEIISEENPIEDGHSNGDGAGNEDTTVEGDGDTDALQETEVQILPPSLRNETRPALLADFSTTFVSNETLHGVSANRGRHLSINPTKSSAIATSGVTGGLEIWEYSSIPRRLSRVALLDATSFRRETQKASAIAWSPNGKDIAMGFEYQLDGKIEFCVAHLDRFRALEDAKTPQVVPQDRVSIVKTQLHGLGLSSIAWVPSMAHGSATRHLVTTGRAEKDAVLLWTESDSMKGVQSKWLEMVLHAELHQDSVQALCVHSRQGAVFTGARDGHVVQCSLHTRQATSIMLPRSSMDVLNINAVLEHPTDPNVLIISSVEASQNRVLLHDLRQQYDGVRSAASVLVVKSYASTTHRQHVEPRWSPTGVHISCGGPDGIVSLWDVRATTSLGSQPHQSVDIGRGEFHPMGWDPFECL